MMIESVLSVFNRYRMALPTLFLIISNINRYLSNMKTRILNRNTPLCIKSIEEFRLSALIILNLTSKYNERVAYKISELSAFIGLHNYSGAEEPCPEQLRFYECIVMKSLDFKIGGDPIIFDQIVNSLKCLETNLPLTFSQTLSSIKSKSVQIALNY